ncbi:MAG: ABC transporter substrate-binding protein, partial [Alphaproteobacteria bacterium]
KLVDFDGKPTTKIDFTVPTDGFEAPWGMAQFNFIWDTASVATPPQSMDDLLAWSGQNPGRLSYPRPPDFIGSTFLKQILIAKAPDASVLQKPVDEADFEATAAPLWAYLDALHPSLWRQGREFPANGPAQRQLLDDGELDVMMSFYPSEAGSLVKAGNLPETVKSFGLSGGTIGNTHFVAIPYNAAAREGAMVLANYLMSAEAQATKQNQEFWGDATVLNVDALTGDDKAHFDALDATSAVNVGAALLEPHPSWMVEVEKAWESRYSN